MRLGAGLLHGVEREVGNAPSTLHLIFPEVYLGSAEALVRIRRIQDTMRRYVAEGLFASAKAPFTTSEPSASASAAA